MKKVLCLVLCICMAVSFCACGNKNEADDKPVNTEVSDKADEKIDKIAEAAKDKEADLEKSRDNVSDLKEELEEKGEKMNSTDTTAEDKTKYENEQLAVAIMEMALDDLAEAREKGDADAEKEALDNIEMAQSIWNWDGKTE